MAQTIQARKSAAFDRIADILFPNGDRDADWKSDTIERIAEEVISELPEVDTTRA